MFKRINSKKIIIFTIGILLLQVVFISFLSNQTSAQIDANSAILSKLQDDAYEKYSEESVAQQSSIEKEVILHKFEKPVDGFYFEFEQPEKAFEIFFDAIHTDNTKSERVAVNLTDEQFGTEASDVNPTPNVSQLYTSIKKYTELKITKPKDVKVKVIEVSSTFEQDNVIASSVDRTTNAELQPLKKQFFNNLGVNLITREEWGAPSTSPWGPWIVPPSKIIVHHTATSVNNSDPAQAVRSIYNFHYYRCGNNIGSYDPNREDCNEEHEIWTDIGYNYLIDQFGNIYEGRAGGNGVVAAHAGGNNYGSIGISIIGNYSYTSPTQASLNSLSKLIGILSKLNDFTPAVYNNVLGHRNVSATACPGEVLYSLLPTIVSSSAPYTSEKLEFANKIADKYDVVPANDLVKNNSKMKFSIDQTSLTNLQKNKLFTDNPSISQVGTFKDSVIFEVDESFKNKVIKEAVILNSTTQIEPLIQLKKDLWVDDGSGRRIPSDFDTDGTNIHWNLNKINAPEAWAELGGCATDELCGGDPNIVVAVIDSGVAYENFNYDAGGSYVSRNISGLTLETPSVDTPNGIFNEGYDRVYTKSPQLQNVNFVAPYDAAQDYLCSLRLSSADPCNAAELAKIDHANDDDGHGTFVTTIIAGDAGGDQSTDQIVGIAHNVSVMPIKAFLPNDSSMGIYRGVSFSTILAWSIYHAVDNGADVINMSLSGSGTSASVQNAINYANDNGVVVVVSSGNNNDDASKYFPANMNNVITVGASTLNDQRASYSNYGSVVDLVAPVGGGTNDGTPIAGSQWFTCSANDSCYREDQGNKFDEVSDYTSSVTPATAAGTSFSAPQVSAAVALVKSRDINYSNKYIELALKVTSRKMNNINLSNLWGYGELNLDEFLKYTNIQTNRIDINLENDNRMDFYIKNTAGTLLINYSRSGLNFIDQLLYYYGGDDVPLIMTNIDEDRVSDIIAKDSRGRVFIDYFKNGYGSWDRIMKGYGGSGALLNVSNFSEVNTSDISIYTTDGKFFIDYASNGFGSWDFSRNYGIGGILTISDYDGDGLDDLSIKDDNGIWRIDYSANGFNGWDESLWGYGGNAMLVSVADYDGDGKSDISLKNYKGTWYIDYSNNGFGSWDQKYYKYGGLDALTYSGDYDGDGYSDLAVLLYRNRLLVDYSENGLGTWDISYRFTY